MANPPQPNYGRPYSAYPPQQGYGAGNYPQQQPQQSYYPPSEPNHQYAPAPAAEQSAPFYFIPPAQLSAPVLQTYDVQYV
jgi:hypothetical protein